MRIARISTESGTDFAIAATEGGWIPLRSLGINCPDTPSVFDQLGRLKESELATVSPVVVDDAELLSPILRPSKILAIGLNYLDHVKEANRTPPERPLLFAKYPNAIVGPADAIVVDPSLTSKADWEVELAVVIGRRTRGIAEKDARSAVGGYLVANDVSARDWQAAEPQWSRSKGFDTFCPTGPWITTADEVADPHDLWIRTWVNEEVMQDSSTSQLLFGVDQLVAFLASTMTLEPGDVILTGTPPGVGMAKSPPRFLRPGDRVTCEIAGLGAISNPVIAP